MVYFLLQKKNKKIQENQNQNQNQKKKKHYHNRVSHLIYKLNNITIYL